MLVKENIDDYNRKTDEYIVAYFDLLGITSRIKSYTKEQELSMNDNPNPPPMLGRMERIVGNLLTQTLRKSNAIA